MKAKQSQFDSIKKLNDKFREKENNKFFTRIRNQYKHNFYIFIETLLYGA